MTDERPTAAEFRAASGRFATGITVVTATVPSPDGSPDSTGSPSSDHAMTANSFSSVSLDPPLVLVCVERAARFHDAVLAAGQWAVSVLPASAQPVAAWFARRGRPLAGQLDGVPHHRGRVTGAPLLDGSLATLECSTWAVYDGGDHDIVVGLVHAVEVTEPGGSATPEDPLLYFRSRYHRIGAAEPTDPGLRHLQ